MDARLKERRVEILLEIDRLSGKCNCLYIGDQKRCPNCKKIHSLGDQLLKLVDKRAVINKDNKKTYSVVTEDGNKANEFLEDFAFTKLEYLSMRNKEGLSDRQIMQQTGVCQRDLNVFKEYTHISEVDGVVKSKDVRLNSSDGAQRLVDTFPINKSKYLDMKNNQQIPDTQIMKEIGVSLRRLTTWKRLVGLLNSGRAHTKIDSSKREEKAAARRETKMKEYYKLKEETNLNDAQIAEKLGVAFSTLWKWKKQDAGGL